MGKIKNFVKNHGLDVLSVVILAAVVFCCGYDYYLRSRTANDYRDVNRTVDNVETRIDRADNRAKSAQTEIKNAEVHIRRADKTSRELTKRSEQNTRELERCRRFRLIGTPRYYQKEERKLNELRRIQRPCKR